MGRIQIIFLLFSGLSFFSYGQQADSSASKPDFATLYVYHPKYELRGVFNVYKEGRAQIWVRPKQQHTEIIDFKFGEEYFLECWLVKNENAIEPMIKLVDTSRGRQEIAEMQARIDSVEARRERRKLDTIL